MTVESSESLFSQISDPESLYDIGTHILGLDDGGLTEFQQDFKRCYDLWLGLGSGFSAVVSGTYLASLPRAVRVFERVGVAMIATPGRLVLAQFESRALFITEEDIGDFTIDDDVELNQFLLAIERIDEDYMDQIWGAADIIEKQLIALACET